jgi:hypothetical protein
VSNPPQIHAPEDPGTSPSRPRGAALVFAAIPLAVHAFLAWRLRAPGISTGQDDAVYQLLGRGLRDLTYSNYWMVESFPHVQYPPLYPFILGITGAIFGDSLTPALVLSVLLSTLALGILFAIAYRWSPPAAFLALSVGAVNPWLVRLAGQMFTEPLYMVCVALTLWFLAAPVKTTRSRFAACALAVASFLTRVIGVAMIATVLIQLFIERRYRAAVVFGVASLLCVGGWFVRGRIVAGAGPSGQAYIGDVLSTRAQANPTPDAVAAPPPAPAPTPAPAAVPPQGTAPSPPAPAPAAVPSTPPAPAASSPDRFVSSIPGLVSVLVQRVASNVPAYLTQRVPTVLAFPTIPGTTLDNWLWLAIIMGLGGLGLWELGRRLPAAAIYLACYAGILLVWPYSLPRFLAPVIPLLLLVLFLGLARLVRQRRDARAWALPSVLALLLVVSGLGENRSRLSEMARCDRGAPYTSEGCYEPVERAFFAAVMQADREAPAGALFMSPKVATVYFLTGRKSVEELSPRPLEPAKLRQRLRSSGVEYIVLTRIQRDQMWRSERLRQVCDEWEVRGEYADGALLLRRILQPSQEQTQTTCEAFSRFLKGPW